MDLGLVGKRVLVTGSTRGIGLAIAQAFQAEGSAVAFTARSNESIAALPKSVLQPISEQKLMQAVCDFTDIAAVKRLAQEINSFLGGLDILICNVGSGKSVPDALPEKQHFDLVMNLNFDAAVNAVREFLPILELGRSPAILFISSIAGMECIGAPTAYSVSKAALASFSKNLASKVAESGVRVNCIAPGNILFAGGSWDLKAKESPIAVQDMLKSKVPMCRFGAPTDIANACLFLCSDAASFITGATLVVDGGQTTRIA